MKKLLRALIINLYLAVLLQIIGGVGFAHSDYFDFFICVYFVPPIFLIISVILAIVNIIKGFSSATRLRENVYKTIMRTKISLIPCAFLSVGACYLFYLLTVPLSYLYAPYLLAALSVTVYLVILASSSYAVGYSINIARLKIDDLGKMKSYCVMQFFPVLDVIGIIQLYKSTKNTINKDTYFEKAVKRIGY